MTDPIFKQNKRRALIVTHDALCPTRERLFMALLHVYVFFFNMYQVILEFH